MCDCIIKKKKQLIAAALNKNSLSTIKNVDDLTVDFDMTEKINNQQFILIPFKIFYNKKIVYETKLVPTYCPFCGKKLNLT